MNPFEVDQVEAVVSDSESQEETTDNPVSALDLLMEGSQASSPSAGGPADNAEQASRSPVGSAAHSAEQAMRSSAGSIADSAAQASRSPVGSAAHSAEQAMRSSAGSIADSAAQASRRQSTGDSVLGAAGAAAQGAASASDRASQSGSLEGNLRELLSSSARPANITDADRAKAKERLLSNELMALLPTETQANLKQMQSALIDGNLDAMKEVLKKLSADPAKVRQFVDIVNRTLSRHEGFGGIDLSMDGQGNVLIYEENGNTAVSINPANGATTLRAVERLPDGSVLLKPGEIINRQAPDVMRNIGDAATRSIVGPQINSFEFEPGWRHRRGRAVDGTDIGERLQNLLNDSGSKNTVPQNRNR